MASGKNSPYRGIYVFDPNTNFKTFFQDCRSWGVNYPTINPYLLEEEGLQEILYRGKESFCLNFPVFFDQNFLHYNPDYYSITNRRVKAVSNGRHFVCPTRVDFIEYKKDQLAKLITLFAPKAVCFDFIRFFVFWEKVYPQTPLNQIEEGCYCPSCIEKFQNFIKIEIPSRNRSEWIRNNVRDLWGQWKCTIIEDVLKNMVSAVKKSNKNITVLIKTIPWSPLDFEGAIFSVAGQDIIRLAKHTDYIVPMSFTHMLKQNLKWKIQTLREARALTGKKVISYIQVTNTYRTEPITMKQFKEDCESSYNTTPDGFTLFHYETLKEAPGKLEFFMNLWK